MRWTKIITSALAIVLLNISCQVENVNCAKILGLFPSHSPSHLIVHMSVIKALAERGHNLTIVAPIKPKVTHKNVRTIIIPLIKEKELLLEEQVTGMTNKKNSFFGLMMNMLGSMNLLFDVQADIIKNERFQELYNEKFDLVIMGYFMNDFALGVAAKFKCPIIVDWTGAAMPMTDILVGNPSEISYVPNMNMGLKITERMTFMQRVQNYLTYYFMKFMHTVMTYRFENYYRELFPSDDNFPTLADMRKNVSLLFCNNHFSEGPIRPYVPALVEIGGIQIKDKPDKLPQEIAEFMDGSKKNGAIFFSLGSNIKSAHMQPEIVNIIFKTLSSLKQNVIWKWENESKTPGTAPNILYKKWVPQDDILAHPNLKLFITHAGKGGIAEAQYHGVPMVALPVFADQHGNAEKIAASGYGVQLELLKITESTLKAAILEVLENDSYARNVKKFSQLYRDRPLTAKETVVFWTEYVLRHHGAAHIQSPLAHMNFIQSSSLDVIVLLCLGLYIFCKVTKLSFRFICGKLCKKCKKTDKNKLKKQ